MQKLKSLFISTVTIGLITLLSACSNLDGAFDEISWQMNFDLVQTNWDVQFKDAANGELIGKDNELRVEVNLSGPDQNHILDMAGIRHDIFFSTKGFLGLILHPDRTDPVETNPVQFTMHVKIDGYLPVHIPVETFKTGIHPVEVMLVDLDSPPANVHVLYEENAGLETF